MIKIYDVGKGENLWDAIIKSGYCNYDPPIVQDWLEEQAKSYMSEEWDHDYIRDFFDDLHDSQRDIFYEVLRDHKIDLDDAFWGQINRNDLLRWSEEYLSSNSEVMALTDFDSLKKDYDNRMRKREVCNELYNFIIEDLDKGYEGKREHKAYLRASEDFNIFIEDIDKDNDDEVRQFFGKELKLEGYEIDGDEYDISEVFICPDCEEARPIEKQKDDWEMYYPEHERPYDSTVFICDDCGREYKIRDLDFIRSNKHLPKEDIIARCV